MNIRFATTQDIPGMIDLLRQVGEVHHQIRPDIFRSGAQKYDETALQELLRDKNRPILIAEVDGTVGGYAFCILKTTENDPVLMDAKTLYIDDLCVDESRRGQGIAQAIYGRVKEYARELGCNTITLNVWCGNDNAIGFYEKAGLLPRNIMMEYKL